MHEEGQSSEGESSKSFEDERELVLERLTLAHEAWFNVFRGYEYAGHTFPSYAEFHSHGEKYVLTKRAKLWEVDAHEYLFFEIADCLNLDEARSWIEFMSTKGMDKVDPVPNHMNSYVSLVLVANSVDKAAEKAICKTRVHKEFKFGLRGWADVRLAVVDLSQRRVLTNAAGKEMKAALEGNAGFERSGKSLFKRR